MIALFLLYTLCIGLAWKSYYRTSIGLFIVFLIGTAAVFFHHISDPLLAQF